MGTITEICTGKTATLTQNNMNVESFFVAGKQIRNSTYQTFVESNLNDTLVELVKDVIILNTDARVEMSEDARYVPTGNGTEAGMLRFLQRNEIAIQDLLSQRERAGTLETTIPFGPIRKRQLVAVRPSPNSPYVRVVLKGAPEYILPKCNY